MALRCDAIALVIRADSALGVEEPQPMIPEYSQRFLQSIREVTNGESLKLLAKLIREVRLVNGRPI